MIQNFDEEAYLEANPDVQEAVQRGDFPSVEIYLEQFGLKRIEVGKTKFHKDLEPFSEQSYLEEFPEVEALVKSGAFKSAFDHFTQVGYSTMLSYLENKNNIISSPQASIAKDERLIKGFDEAAYLEANPNVEEAISKGGFPDIEIYLAQFGLERLRDGEIKFHKDLEPFSEKVYLKEFPEVEVLIQDNNFSSAFDHFCKAGYEMIMTKEKEWSKIREVDDKEVEIFSYVDDLTKIDELTLFLSGWYYGDKNISIKDILIIPDNGTINFFNHPRGDLKKEAPEEWKEAGFYGIIKLDKPMSNIDNFGLTFQVGETKSYKKWPVIADLDTRELSTKMLLPIEIRGSFRKVFEEAFGPALDSLWQKHYEVHSVHPEVTSYGNIPEQPELSIIVPLYGRIDFMEYQLSIFANDSDFNNNVELIYVLDDPDRFGETIHEVSQSLYNLMNVPFKVVSYESNLGYARANNVGVSFATSDKILLLNSDVFPKENGWVTRMLEIYKTLEAPGTLGFKLLFEDDSIQHAGMIFERNPYLDDMWTNMHPHKGMPDLENDFIVKEVPAVTGACMLLEKQNYLDVGGLSENYVLGDFEDSDLCLKLMEKGLKIYYSTEPSLYHLERQSQSLFDDQAWKFKITVFNCWQQTKQWNDTIVKTMEHFDA